MKGSAFLKELHTFQDLYTKCDVQANMPILCVETCIDSLIKLKHLSQKIAVAAL